MAPKSRPRRDGSKQTSKQEDMGWTLSLGAPQSTVAATVRLGCTSESKHATYLHATQSASTSPLCKTMRLDGLHARARLTPREVASHESSFAPPATLSASADTLAGAQPPSAFHRPSADCTQADLPNLLQQAGATHGVQRTWQGKKQREEKTSSPRGRSLLATRCRSDRRRSR